MPKHSKHQRSKSISIPRSHGEMARIVRNMGVEINRLHGMYEMQRRLVWLLVHKEGGRVQLDRDEYNMTMQTDMKDLVIKLEDDKPNKLVILDECDNEWEPVSKIVRPG